MTKSNTICFYHNNDSDGFASGAITKLFFENKNQDIELYGINYGDKFPWDKITNETEVVMCDFSLSIEDMIKLKKISKSFIWIDHHTLKIKDIYNKTNNENYFNGVRSFNEESGCSLTWKYFFPNKSIPIIIDWLSTYDIFKESDTRWNNIILPFQYGIKIMNMNPVNEKSYMIWKKYLSIYDYNVFESIINIGKQIIIFIKQQNINTIEKNGFECKLICNSIKNFDQYKIFCVNTEFQNSLTFESVKDKYDIFIAYSINKSGNFVYSLYTFNKYINVAEICKYFGGGGHPGAAGFVSAHSVLNRI